MSIAPSSAPVSPAARTPRAGRARVAAKTLGADESPAPQRRHLAAKRAAAIGALVALTAALVTACVLFGEDIVAFVSDPDAVRAWAAANAPWSQLAFVAANVAQVVFAFLPGEPLELAAGYAFGFWLGTALCLLASALGTAAIVAAVRRWGVRVVNLFFSTEKIASVSWLADTGRFELVLFAVFLIPGTPKDLLTYVACLGSCSLPRIVAITTVGRIPSIITSTLAAGALGDGNYALAIGTAAVAVALVAVGALVYRRVAGTRAARTEAQDRDA